MNLAFPKLLICITMCAWLAACVAPTPANQPLPTPPPTQATSVDHAVPVVGVSFQIEGSASGSPEVAAGSTAHFLVALNPSLITVKRRSDGSIDSVIWETWKDRPDIQMRACFSAIKPCSPGGPWGPFQSQVSKDVPVDWLGERTFYSSAEFRTSTGEIIPAGTLGQDSATPVYSASMTITSLVTTTPSAGQLPAPVLTEQAATQAAFPVSGSIVIENGNCCAGGTEGTQIPLHVQFQASSPAGRVTEMRIGVGSCQRNSASLDAPWEPLVPSKTYTVTLMLNWTSFQLSVQYRDEKDNLSPVYCANISLEGMPKP